MTGAARPGEFELIARLFAPLAAGMPGAFGLIDDAAVLSVPQGKELVVTVDAIVAGVHFLPDDPPGLIAQKLLRVNLSDLAAKGAEPAAYLLTLVLPKSITLDWLEAFAAGLAQDQKTFGIQLAGGDTTASDGPLALSVTALGFVPIGGMVRRRGARPGDLIFVTGTIGDGSLGLAARQGDLTTLAPAARDALCARYLLPEPRTAFGRDLSRFARAAIDVSDGLVADLGHLLAASGVGAALDLARVPLSPAAQAALEGGLVSLDALVTGGDDYEILFTAPPEALNALRAAAGSLAVTEIGVVTAAPGLTVTGPDGVPVQLTRAGFQHF